MLPYNIFNATENTSSDDQLYREGGSIPEMLFLEMPNCCMLWLLPRLDGIEPTSWLVVRSRYCRWDRLPSDGGMSPVKLLFLSEITARDVSFSPSSAGMRPPSWLLRSLSLVMLMQELRFTGIFPEKELSLKSSFSRRRRRPRLAGISPWSRLKLRLSVRRNERFPRAGESAPASPLPSKLSSTTLEGLQRLHITPSQLQKPALLFQEASEPASLTCALKASSAASSPALTVAVIRATTSDHMKLIIPMVMPMLVPGMDLQS
nr:uncharacterized protein LOC123494160 [Aegilops tauschii subsp. strangulata]XP_045084908.1 uncharacterized protein LOC123494160 [Aegilops tauschii subsp. strangulata]XP_045084910.1 uncharacterized protein LOC123494160 [Aegilops tauschii subsp. strangulata]XP_045084911.1 uncharacterized protein LOC123494160 [Aegilops tauschii subsp. strangulata]XP_045084912.1 uncharacterized protein LOC123494160 [Aegilops tauschii subsp. strangulata]XP_045084913.1 uncharacterized protein LOC123494160 [Aegilop